MQSFVGSPSFTVAVKIYHTLRAAGHETFFAGGCVRDGLLGVAPKDFDLATSAKPEQVEALFAKTVAVGKAFGVIVVLEDGEAVEVTTFRKDGTSTDARRPTEVQWSSAEMDAQRRDLTVNALFWDLETDKVIDYVGGWPDLKAGVLRTVGDPAQRFAEDHLRVLRVVRFVGQLGFQIEEKTLQAVKQFSTRVATVSAERRREEMTKLLTSATADQALQIWESSGLAAVLWPGWRRARKFEVTRPSDAPDLSIELVAWAEFMSHELEVQPAITWAQQEAKCRAWTFSRQMQQQLKAFLQWRNPDAAHWSLGAGLEKLWQSDARAGLYRLAHWQGTKMAPSLQKLLQHWLSLPSAKRAEAPAPLLAAADVAASAQGARIGEVLRACYWAQLEGVVKTRDQALDWARQFLQKA